MTPKEKEEVIHAYKLASNITDFKLEVESKEYEASRFLLGSDRVLFRKAKITPKKQGLFVTLWKRLGKGPITPFDASDPFDLFIASVHTGHFLFPKQILSDRGVISKNHKGGKRALRLYAPNLTLESSQARKTQEWQAPYYVELEN